MLRIRFLHLFLFGEQGVLRFSDSDQKPCWFTAAADLKTAALKGQEKVIVNENVPLTRMRFTTMTLTEWPDPPAADPADGERRVAFLFKAASDGAQIRKGLEGIVPDDCLLQFGPKGSYRRRVPFTNLLCGIRD